MATAKILDIYGSEGSYVSGHKLTIPISEEMYFNLSRLGLTHCERAIVEYVMACRYSVSKRQIPSIRKMAADIGISYSHARRCVKRLEELGLQVKRSPGKRALLFVRNLFLKLRKLIDTNKREARSKRVNRAAAPAPIPMPEPEPTPEPPASAETPALAAEWDTIQAAAMEKVNEGARHWFEGAKGYRVGSEFVIVAPDRVKGDQLARRYHDLLVSLIGKYCRWCKSVRYVVAKASA